LLETGKGPFFGGSEKITLAEVQTGSFVLRLLAFAKPENGLVSAKLSGLLETVPRFKRWAEETVKQESVNFIWEEKVVVERTKAKWAPKA
jgi:glutathione S-transferase